MIEGIELDIIGKIKQCSYCKLFLLESEFYRDRQTKDGLRYCCKKCSLMQEQLSRGRKTGNYLSIIKRMTSSVRSVNKTCYLDYKQIVCLYVSQNGKCIVLDKPVSLRWLSIDHIKPTHAGGTNEITNLIFIHNMLNKGKNGFNMNLMLTQLGYNTKETWQRIIKTHETYNQNIGRFLVMSDSELENEVKQVLERNKLTHKAIIT